MEMFCYQVLLHVVVLFLYITKLLKASENYLDVSQDYCQAITWQPTGFSLRHLSQIMLRSSKRLCINILLYILYYVFRYCEKYYKRNTPGDRDVSKKVYIRNTLSNKIS